MWSSFSYSWSLHCLRIVKTGQDNPMGISDRDYMREPTEPPNPKKPRPHIQKADNKPPLAKRIRFWLWNLKNRK